MSAQPIFVIPLNKNLWSAIGQISDKFRMIFKTHQSSERVQRCGGESHNLTSHPKTEYFRICFVWEATFRFASVGNCKAFESYRLLYSAEECEDGAKALDWEGRSVRAENWDRFPAGCYFSEMQKTPEVLWVRISSDWNFMAVSSLIVAQMGSEEFSASN